MDQVHHERVAIGHPGRWLLMLHGILGTGANWRSIARRVVAARPSWGAILVDLRGHGRSYALGGPWTLDRVADDREPLDFAAVLGHSFGGKIALLLSSRRPVDPLVLVDGNPGPRPTARGSEATTDVLSALRTLPATFADRRAFVAALEARGQPPSVAQWLAMNLVRDGDGVRFGPDLDGIEALLADYFARDLWPLLEGRTERTHAIVGGSSTVLDAADRARLSACPSVELHVVEGAGHWVHADAPDEVLRLLTSALG